MQRQWIDRVAAAFPLLLLLLVGCIATPLPAEGDEAAARPATYRNALAASGLDLPVVHITLADLDGDGWLDIIANASRLYLNRPRADDPRGESRRFIDFTEESGIAIRPSYLPQGEAASTRPTFLICGDVDNDGDLDLFSGVRSELEFWQKDEETGEPQLDESGRRLPKKLDPGWRNEILLNDGGARFTVVEASGVSKPAETTSAATFVDFDRDGVLDLFVGNWYRSYGWSYDAYPDRLFRGRGDGTFVDITEQAGLLQRAEAGERQSRKPTFGVAAIDWNQDGWPDLFSCSYGRQWNQLWRNEGDGTFTDVGGATAFDGDADRSGRYPDGKRDAELPFRANGNTFDVSFADFDEDGDPDAFLGEITHAWAGSSSDLSMLLENLGAEQTFRFARRVDVGIDRTHLAERWNQGDIYTTWIDADGDGREDLLIASGDYPDDQRLRLFVQDREHRFHDRTAEFGLDWPASAMPSVGDLDGDGDPDVVVGRTLHRLGKARRAEIGDRPALWIREGSPSERWSTLRLRGRGAGGCNVRGIGCRVSVEVGGRVLHRWIQSASGHSGRQNPDEILIPFGSAERIDRCTIEWLNAEGTRSVVEDLPAGAVITIFESEGKKAPRVQVTRRQGK